MGGYIGKSQGVVQVDGYTRAEADAAIAASTEVTRSATAPASSTAGDLWFDTVNNAMKTYNGTSWDQLSNKFSATGGTESTYTSGGVTYKVHTFTSSGTFTAGSSGSVDVLLVAGGGAGGHRHAGGGGAGGVIASANKSLYAGSFTIVVGGGGYTAFGGVDLTGPSGSNTTAFGLTAVGGGGGGPNNNNGVSGGSGGGGGERSTSGGSGTAGQGNSGGGSGSSGYGGSGGGGGAGASGTNGSSGGGAPGNGSGDNLAAANGGSGIVIIRYAV